MPPVRAGDWARGYFAVLLLALAALLTALSAVVLFAPGFEVVVDSREADHVINTAATLVAAAVAALGWIRFRETGQLENLLAAAAFLVLFAGNGVALLLLLAGSGRGVRIRPVTRPTAH